MERELETISLSHLAIVAILPLIVIVIFFRWSLSWKTAVYGLVRMVVQLLAIGYFLAYIFDTERSLFVLAVLTVMLFVASWIAFRPVRDKQRSSYLKALALYFGRGNLCARDCDAGGLAYGSLVPAGCHHSTSGNDFFTVDELHQSRCGAL